MQSCSQIKHELLHFHGPFFGISLDFTDWCRVMLSQFQQWNKSESASGWCWLCWPVRAVNSCWGPQALLWVKIHARSTAILICLTNLWRVCMGGCEWYFCCEYMCVFELVPVLWRQAILTIPANVNNLRIKNYQKITPHNTEINSFRFGFGYAFTNLIGEFVFRAITVSHVGLRQGRHHASYHLD